MTLWIVPIWTLTLLGLSLLLLGVLVITLRARRHLHDAIGSDLPGVDLTRRIMNVNRLAKEHHAALVRDREHFDQLSAETRAIMLAMEAERKGDQGGRHPHHAR